MTTEFFSWDSLKSVTNIALCTGLITQVTKTYIPIPTQVWAYIVATLILIVQDIKSKSFSNIPLSIINGFVIASLTSNTVSLINRM